jgi:uncharacterized protein (DUF2225 family)
MLRKKSAWTYRSTGRELMEDKYNKENRSHYQARET